jgi:5-methylcytosine-specific restriction endonuclease McrA
LPPIIIKSETNPISAISTYNLCSISMTRSGGRCVFYGTTDDLTIDHIIPLIRGGQKIIGGIERVTPQKWMVLSNKK